MINPERIAIVQRDGTTRVETVHGWSWRSGQPAIYAELTWWQQAIRRLTPTRWRKPIPVVRAATLDSVELDFGPIDPGVIARAQKNLASIHKMAETLAGGR